MRFSFASTIVSALMVGQAYSECHCIVAPGMCSRTDFTGNLEPVCFSTNSPNSCLELVLTRSQLNVGLELWRWMLRLVQERHVLDAQPTLEISCQIWHGWQRRILKDCLRLFRGYGMSTLLPARLSQASWRLADPSGFS